MHYGSYITAFRETLISYGNKKITSYLRNGRKKTYSQKFPRTSIMSHGNKALLFQFLNLIIAIKKGPITFWEQVTVAPSILAMRCHQG